MTSVLALLGEDPSQPLVQTVASSVAAALSADVRPLRLSTEGRERVSQLLDELEGPGVEAMVVSAQSHHEPYWDLIQRSSKPVVIIPRHAEDLRTSISDVLVPLDGDLHTAKAVGVMAKRLTESGSRVVALHVFDATTAPAFWDQAAHARDPWTEEFLQRNLPVGTLLDVRRGSVAAEVMSRADELRTDLILLGWARRLNGGRAPTVRRALVEGRVPVMLMAVDGTSR